MHKLKFCKKAYTFLFIACCGVLSSNLFAEQHLEEYYRLFKTSNYSKALKVLAGTDFATEKLSTKHYLLGITHSRLQEFDRAIINFEKAIQLKTDAQDIYYEYGQALYAANELKKSRMAFEESITKNFNRDNSLYYVGHISQILEDYQKSKDSFAAVVRNKNADDKIVQVARFQMAETLLLVAREKKNTANYVEKYIIPMMNTALAMDKNSPVAKDISQRILELTNEFKLDPNVMVNGRRLSTKRYTLTLGQKIKFDNNVTLANDQSTTVQSKKESYILESEAFGKRDFVFKKRYIVSPESRVTYTRYTDTENATVYQNNAYLINFALRSKVEHTLRGQPASAIVEFESNYTARDKYQQKKLNKYATSKTFTIGEKFKLSSWGDSSLKFKYKDYNAYSDSLDNKTKTVVFDHTKITGMGHLVIFLVTLDFIENYRATSNSTDSYLFRIDYLIPEIIPQYSLGFGLSTTLLDTKEQKATRGTEKNIAPSIDLSRDVTDRFKVGFNYEFTKNISKSDSNEYTKHVLQTELKYSF